MAKRTIARRNTPVPPEVSAQTASDILENKLAQLKSLLWCCYGDADWLWEAGVQCRDNVMWIAFDLVSDAVDLHQECMSKGARI
ncbi:hypothetical protein [Variovorax sp. 770b2]|uniref:hypothetical protein n=1 Tax=Variovorax sp. 770b2 TaxID=1566271 RepID=UPI0008E2380F|nr:hypothetical protein [Variovorax sp. 770b2]SFP90992.1 hypothetical protein SAMN03159339_4548 [Variovorax sp. 770b2]